MAGKRESTDLSGFEDGFWFSDVFAGLEHDVALIVAIDDFEEVVIRSGHHVLVVAIEAALEFVENKVVFV